MTGLTLCVVCFLAGGLCHAWAVSIWASIKTKLAAEIAKAAADATSKL